MSLTGWNDNDHHTWSLQLKSGNVVVKEEFQNQVLFPPFLPGAESEGTGKEEKL